MNNYQRALSGYSNSAGEINSNLGAWRADVDNVVAGNKSGLQNAVSAAQSQVDLNALTGIGEEFAIRGAKKYGTKLLGGIYEKTGLKTLDQRAGKFLTQKVKNAVGRGGADAGDVADSGEGVELDNLTGGSGTGGELPMSEIGSSRGETKSDVGDETKEDMGDDIEPATEEPGMSFDEFMNSFEGTPMTESGDIDFDAIDRSRNASAVRDEPQTEQVAQQQDVETRNTANQAETDATPEDIGGSGVDATNPTSAITDGADDAVNAAKNVATDAGDAAADALKSGASAAKSIASDGANALKTGVDDAVGDGLEAAGAALDATGILAPLGVLAQVAGGALELGGIYQMGEGLVNWWDTAVLGDKPKVNFTAAKAPVAPPTLATRGLMAAPTMDSNFDIPSTAGGW